jgi:hypothetical protein
MDSRTPSLGVSNEWGRCGGAWGQDAKTGLSSGQLRSWLGPTLYSRSRAPSLARWCRAGRAETPRTLPTTRPEAQATPRARRRPVALPPWPEESAPRPGGGLQRERQGRGRDGSPESKSCWLRRRGIVSSAPTTRVQRDGCGGSKEDTEHEDGGDPDRGAETASDRPEETTGASWHALDRLPGVDLLYVNTGMEVFGHDAILGQEGQEGWAAASRDTRRRCLCASTRSPVPSHKPEWSMA